MVIECTLIAWFVEEHLQEVPSDFTPIVQSPRKIGGNKMLVDEMESLESNVSHGEDLKAKVMVNLQVEVHKEKRTLFVGSSKVVQAI